LIKPLIKLILSFKRLEVENEKVINSYDVVSMGHSDFIQAK